jgi:hypothetical protein
MTTLDIPSTRRARFIILSFRSMTMLALDDGAAKCRTT